MTNLKVQITPTLKIVFAELGQSMREYKWQKRNTTENVFSAYFLRPFKV